MRIDLLVPRFPPAHWNFSYAMGLEGSRYSHPPLGAATLAAYTPPGVDVRIHDENAGEVRLEDLAPIVGISAMYIQRRRAFELARALRALGRRVVLGGSLVNALPAECARHADALVHGEAELTWPRLIEDLDAGRLRPVYEAPRPFDMAASRTPRFDLLPMRLYSTGSIQTSRGCPYACDYCDVPLIDGPRPRVKTVTQAMAEIEALSGMGMRSIFIVDDNFLGNRKYARRLLDEIARFLERTPRKPLFYCQATLNVAKDEETLEALYRANFRRLFIGIESSDVRTLEGVNKAHNTAMPPTLAVRRIQAHNITVWAALLAGFDDDGPDVFDRYLDFVREAKIAMVIPGLLQAVPGTAFHAKVRAEGRLVPLRNGYVGGQAGSLDSLLVTNVAPRRMTREELLAGYRRFARALYEHDAYADRVIGFLEAGREPELSGATLRDVWDARGVLARVARYYLVEADPERRRFFLRIARHLVASGLCRVDEAVFHLVIYKHLREFYFQAADAAVPTADDLTTLPPESAAMAAEAG